MEPIPLETVVDYHGSRTHGRYVVAEHHPVTLDMFQPGEVKYMKDKNLSLTDIYPDGIAYTIWKQGVSRKFGNRMYSVTRVRRQSLTVTDEPLEIQEEK